MKEYIQTKFDFKIALDTPYKLCDYKPLYGYLFEEYIKEYDFWGHCDLDCIFGNIRNFVQEEILEKYEKISFLGHMTLYKNTYETNRRFKCKIGEMDYIKVFESSENFAFDETINSISINTIYKNQNIEMYDEEIFADISCLYYDFRLYHYNKNLQYELEKKNNQVFLWKNGCLFSKKIINGKIYSKEYAYVHFQKRKMANIIDNLEKCNCFLIVPNKFVQGNIEGVSDIKKYKTYRIFYKVFFIQKYKAFKYRIKNRRVRK